MDKVKKFLEGYVQWLAMLLGVAFLGWTVWSYILQKPVSVTVGTHTDVTPPEIAPIITDGPGQDLKVQMDNKESPPPLVPKVDPEVVARSFATPANDPTVASVLNTPWIPVGPTPAIEKDEPVATDLQKVKVQKLPDAPAIINLQVSQGHSNVPAPVPAGGGAPAGQGNAAQNIDKTWNSVEGIIPCKVLAKSFADAKIPPNFQSTCILRVEMYRQEKNPDGSWSAPTTMPSLDINPLKEMVTDNDPVSVQNDYKTWAESSVALICQPPFYQVVHGDVWYEPGTANPNQAADVVIDDGFNPKDPGAFKGDPSTLTPRDKELYDAWLKHKQATDAARARAQQNNHSNNSPTPQIPNDQGGGGPGGPGGGGPGGGGGRSGGGGRRGLANDPSRVGSGDNLQPPPAAPPPQGGNVGGYPDMQNPQQPTAGSTAAAQATLPTGSFDPAQQADIRVWAHDATAQSGHIYRYMLKYVISNPVAHTANLCDPQTLAQQFTIVSADSAWTDPVNVESDTKFYAAEVKGHGIHFDIFQWKNGVWQMQSMQSATAGDMIGSVDPNNPAKTDFTTGWTLVDVRDDPRDEDNKIIVLVSDNGTVKRRELTTDQRSGEYKRLLDEVNKAKAAAGGAPAGQNM